MRIIILLIFLLIGFNSASQNLVPNSGFENHISIPCSWTTSALEFSYYVSDWYVPTYTTSDIHSLLADTVCWTNPMSSNNEWNCRFGNVFPHSGNNMAGIYTYVEDHVWHEYLQVKLKEPMMKGRLYCVQMYVAAATNLDELSNNIGMLFTRDTISGDSEILAHPQINIKALPMEEGWIQVSGYITADDNYEYLTIGNFFPDCETAVKKVKDCGCNDGAYYFIDDVSVIECPI